MNALVLIGYWHSADAPWWPDPAWFIDDAWAPTLRERVLAHLRSGTPLSSAMGASWCRFHCETRWCGSAEFSDGVYVWPEGLAHYVERHAVRLPDEFVAHVLAVGNRPFDQRPAVGPMQLTVDTTWWEHQHGWRAGESWRTPPRIGTFTVRLQHGRATPGLLRLLRRIDGLGSYSYPTLVTMLENGACFILRTNSVERPMPTELRTLADAGLTVEFLPDHVDPM